MRRPVTDLVPHPAVIHSPLAGVSLDSSITFTKSDSSMGDFNLTRARSLLPGRPVTDLVPHPAVIH